MGRKNHKSHIIITTIIVVVIFVALMVGVDIYISHGMAEQSRQELEGLVGYLCDRYPELSETEILECLQGKLGDESVGHEILSRYGYDDEYYRLNLRESRTRMIVWNGAVLIAGILAVICVWLVQNRKQSRKLDEIANYLHEINSGDYMLKTDDNGEDELSLLRNEILKTTVLLRETSEHEKKLNTDLQRSMEDISHQLRTPLASITIMLDDIYDDPDMPADMRRDFIRSISMQISWISSLVNSMLKLAKFDAGTIKMNVGEVDVVRLVEESLEKLSVIADLKSVEIVWDKVPEGLSGVRETVTDKEPEGILYRDREVERQDKTDRKKIVFQGDYNWQLEAVTNIIKNAVEHSHEGGRVWITASQNDVYTEISVRDEGEGISGEEQKHIFERFYRAHNAGKDSIGIGLSLAKSIVEADNGYISVESEEGEGTEFRIRYVRRFDNR